MTISPNAIPVTTRVLDISIPRNSNTRALAILTKSDLVELLRSGAESNGECCLLASVLGRSLYGQPFRISSNFESLAWLSSSRLRSIHTDLSKRCEEQEKEIDKLRRQVKELRHLQNLRIATALLDSLSRKILEALDGASEPIRLGELDDMAGPGEHKAFWLSMAKLIAGDLIVFDDCGQLVFLSPTGYRVLKGQF